jgi:predicted ATP-dependent protease
LLLLPNPDRPSEPTALFLPAGTGRGLLDTMSGLYGKIVDALHAATEGERFKHAETRVQRKARREEARLEQELAEIASSHGFSIERSGDDIELRRGEAEEPASDEAVEAVKTAVEEFEAKLADVHDEADVELRAAIKQFLSDAAHSHFAPVIAKYVENADLSGFFAKLETAVTNRLVQMIDEPRGDDAPMLPRGFVVPTLLTEHARASGAPVIEALYPTLTCSLRPHALSPDAMFPPEPGFAVAGALHQANGGFLILPAAALLKNEGCSTSSSRPASRGPLHRPGAQPLLLPRRRRRAPVPPDPHRREGDPRREPRLFQELHEADPEFSQLFKVQARFESELSVEEAKRHLPRVPRVDRRDRGHLPMSPTPSPSCSSTAGARREPDEGDELSSA